MNRDKSERAPSVYLLAGIVFVLSFAVYFNTLCNGFVYDDKFQVLGNSWIRGLGHMREIFSSDVSGFNPSYSTNYYRPLMHVVYIFNYLLFGLAPWGFHLANVLLHGAVSVLVFLAIGILSGSNGREEQGYSSPAFLGAVLFAAHPVHTEVVAWVSALPELLCALFYLLSLITYVSAKKMKGIWLSALFFFLASLSKEPALTLLAVIIIYDILFKGQEKRPSKVMRYAPFALATIIYFILRLNALGGFAPVKPPHSDLSPLEYVTAAIGLFPRYLEKLVLPINLNFWHDYKPMLSLFTLGGLVSLIILLGCIGLGVFLLKRNKAAFMGLAILVLSLLPALYIPAISQGLDNSFNERYLYLPSFGASLLVLLLPAGAGSPKKKYSIYALCLIMGVFSVLAINRNMVWKDELTLWTDAAKKSPAKARPHECLGAVLIERNRPGEAIPELEAALRINPSAKSARYNLGVAYKAAGMAEKAAREFSELLTVDPDNWEAHNKLGTIYAEKGFFDKAIEHYSAAIRISPSPAAYDDLGYAYLETGRTELARLQFESAIALDPDFANAYNDLGILYLKSGNTGRALPMFQAAVRLNPRDLSYSANLARALNQKSARK
jgi:tetratricopeptide (TPR) repeat protein